MGLDKGDEHETCKMPDRSFTRYLCNRKLLKGLMYVPRVVITDRLKSKRQLNNQPPSTSTVVPVTKSFLIRNKIPDATSSAVPGRGMT